jgi:hypothetical protein
MKKQTTKLVLSKETVKALVTGPHVVGGVTDIGVCASRFCTNGCTLQCTTDCQSGKYPC